MSNKSISSFLAESEEENVDEDEEEKEFEKEDMDDSVEEEGRVSSWKGLLLLSWKWELSASNKTFPFLSIVSSIPLLLLVFHWNYMDTCDQPGQTNAHVSQAFCPNLKKIVYRSILIFWMVMGYVVGVV